VLILDLTLQGGSGLPLIEELTTAMPELRVIVFSGVANSDEVSREAKRRGAAEYVSKGCDIQILFKALRTAQPPVSRPLS
jgi:ActR/RegA family two-component response regulator